jgi:hypothetical protein
MKDLAQQATALAAAHLMTPPRRMRTPPTLSNSLTTMVWFVPADSRRSPTSLPECRTRYQGMMKIMPQTIVFDQRQ